MTGMEGPMDINKIDRTDVWQSKKRRKSFALHIEMLLNLLKVNCRQV
jgi:hypothetical protein